MLKRIYFFIPIVALIIFGIFYAIDSKQIVAQEVAKQQAIEQAHKEKLLQQALAQQKAIEDARKAADERAKEKAAKEAQAAAEKQAFQDAYDARDKAARDVRKYTDRIRELQTSIGVEKDAITKIEQDRKVQTSEYQFLQKFIVGAVTNQNSLRAVLQKIADADAARAAAEAAAAAAKQKS